VDYWENIKMLFVHFLMDCVVDQPAIISNKMLFIIRTSLLG